MNTNVTTGTTVEYTITGNVTDSGVRGAVQTTVNHTIDVSEDYPSVYQTRDGCKYTVFYNNKTESYYDDEAVKKQNERRNKKRYTTIDEYLKDPNNLVIWGYDTNEYLKDLFNLSTRLIFSNSNKSRQSYFILDKNMNILVYDVQKDYPSNCKKIYSSNCRYLDMYEEHFYDVHDQNFIVVNKQKFFESSGEVISIKHTGKNFKNSDKYRTCKKVKRSVKVLKDTLVTLKSYMSEIYEDKLFEITGAADLNENKITWGIDVIYPNVTIKNSTNRSHYIGDMVVKITGFTCLDSGHINLYMDLLGKRLSWSPVDVVRSYNHSHLPSRNYNFTTFCLGTGGMFDGVETSNTSKNDIHHLLFNIESFISWESLEGGPYVKFSTLNFNNSFSKYKYSFYNHRFPFNTRTASDIRKYIPFSELSSAFRIEKIRGRLVYTIDEDRFIQNCLNYPKNEELRSLVNYGIFYDIEKKQFVKKKRNSLCFTKEILRDSLEELENLSDPVYINGKNISVYKNEGFYEVTDKVEKISETVFQAYSPTAILTVGYHYLFKLNKILEDVKK